MRAVQDFNVRQEAYKLLGMSMAKKLEEVMRKAVSLHLGRSDWSIDELKGRLHCIAHVGRLSPKDYFLDGKLILTIWPEDVDSGSFDVPRISFGRKYKIAEVA